MPLLWRDDKGTRWESHTGLVLGSTTRCVRVMSDIYSDENYAQVWNPATFSVEEVHIGGAFDLNTKTATVVVDAPDTVMSLLSARQVEAARRAEEAHKEEVRRVDEARARSEVLAPLKGRPVTVVGGRKVKKGTKGTVFWTDAPVNPIRVGVKDANDMTHWVDARWCEASYADFPVGGTPACGWVAYRDALWAQEESFKATLPKVSKGDIVLIATSGLTGTVFWTKDTRIGVGFGSEKDAQGGYVNKAWADLTQVAAVNGVPVEGVTTPAPPAPPAPVQQEEPTVFVPRDETGSPLPWPYSAIDRLDLEGVLYAAYSVSGEFLLHLDHEGASAVLLVLPHVTLVPATPAHPMWQD